MKIIKTNIEDLANNKKDLYILTKGVTTSVQKLTDEELSVAHPVKDYVLYQDVNTKGEVVEVLAIRTAGFVLSTVSETFKREFFDIVDIMDSEPFAIRVIKGVTRGGRTFYTCALDV